MWSTIGSGDDRRRNPGVGGAAVPAVVRTGRGARVGSVVGVKRPIEPSEIRKGDLIRFERLSEGVERAVEFVYENDNYRSSLASGTYYLLDRPAPAVELPTEPTWGWLTYRDTDFPSANPTVEYGEWKARHDRATALDVHGSTSVPLQWVTAFTPATAVPTEALARLERAMDNWRMDASYGSMATDVSHFLAAVDEASA